MKESEIKSSIVLMPTKDQARRKHLILNNTDLDNTLGKISI